MKHPPAKLRGRHQQSKRFGATGIVLVLVLTVVVVTFAMSITRRATDELIAHLGNPDVALIKTSGHMVPQEAPDECRTLLRNFIFRHNPAV